MYHRQKLLDLINFNFLKNMFIETNLKLNYAECSCGYLEYVVNSALDVHSDVYRFLFNVPFYRFAAIIAIVVQHNVNLHSKRPSFCSPPVSLG
jgi:hypothetical protein